MCGSVQSAWAQLQCVWVPKEQGKENYSSRSPPLGVQYRLGPAVSSNVRGSCCGLILGREAGRKGPAHQVFVNGLPEECSSCLLASHPAESIKPTLRREQMCGVESTQAHLQTTHITQMLCCAQGSTCTLTKGLMHTLAQSICQAFAYRQEDACMCTYTEISEQIFCIY